MTRPAIEVRKLVKRFDTVEAVRGIDLTVATGECVGLLGPNGAGKTTTLEILEGIQEATSGEVVIFDLTWKRDAAQLRSLIGLQLQETHFYEKLTVAETVRLFRSFYARGLTVDAALGLVKLEEKRNSQLGQLSGGQRQRLALATALVSDPRLLFLDEPTTGLDPQSRRNLWDVVEGVKARGTTVVLTTHYMEEAERLCDRVVIIDRGQIVAQGTPKALVSDVGGEQLIDLVAAPPISPEVLRALPGVLSVRENAEGVSLNITALHQVMPALLAAATQAGVVLKKLAVRPTTLDDVFLAHTGRELRDGD